MRVIAGKHKSRKLNWPKTHLTRPTADVVKEAVFSKIFEKVSGSIFLDAFCGSGQMGIEALSRGAAFACFIDKSFLSTKTTKQNLQALSEPNYKVITGDVLKTLAKLNKVFDIIFLDPPYDYENYHIFFGLVHQNNLLSKNGLIVCEHNKGAKLEFENFTKIDTKNYGIRAVSYFTLNQGSDKNN